MTASERKLVREALFDLIAYVKGDGDHSDQLEAAEQALAILDAEDKAGGVCPKCKGGKTLWAGLGTHRMPCGDCNGTGKGVTS
jgi:hypothetical protein